MMTSQFPTNRRRLQATVAVTLLLSSLAAIQPATADGSAQKDHTLFIGLDLAVDRGGKYYTVADATEKDLTYLVDGKTQHVRLDSARNVRIAKGVKLSTLTGSITNIQTDVVNRAAEAAQFDAMKTSMMLGDVAGDNDDRRQGAILQADLATSFNAGANYDPVAAQQFIDATRAAARESFANSVGDSLFAATMANNILTEGLNTGPGETIELSFQISSPTPLEDAYVVVLADYAAPNKPNEISQRISARKLGHIDSKPTTVRMEQHLQIDNLEFKKFDFALFADGQELATNLSKSTAQISADDAYTFFSIDYLASHKGDTLPPMPMLMISRSEFRRLAPAGALDKTIYAKVDKTGSTIFLSLDSSGGKELPDDMAKALEKVRFVPAIEKGVAVDGIAKIKLAQLVR